MIKGYWSHVAGHGGHANNSHAVGSCNHHMMVTCCVSRFLGSWGAYLNAEGGVQLRLGLGFSTCCGRVEGAPAGSVWCGLCLHVALTHSRWNTMTTGAHVFHMVLAGLLFTIASAPCTIRTTLSCDLL